MQREGDAALGDIHLQGLVQGHSCEAASLRVGQRQPPHIRSATALT